MFQRIYQYELVSLNGEWFRPRAYGDPQSDGSWDGYLVFFPVRGGLAISSGRETTQSSLDALTYWASGLEPVYLEGALVRALELNQSTLLADHLAILEGEARADAAALEASAARAEREAVLDSQAPAEADAEAERIACIKPVSGIQVDGNRLIRPCSPSSTARMSRFVGSPRARLRQSNVWCARR
jgi:hypothetical protein